MIFKILLRDQRGATSIEYGLIIALIALAMLVSLTAINGRVGSMWGGIASLIPAFA